MISLSKGLISKNTTSLYSVHGAKTGEPTATSGMTTKVHAPKPNFWCPSLCLQQLAGTTVRGGVLQTSRPVRPDLLPVCLHHLRRVCCRLRVVRVGIKHYL